MDNSLVESLPEKCCAKCGFFYGLLNEDAKAIDRENAIFDPDLVRQATYLPAGPNEELVSTQLYTERCQDSNNAGRGTLMTSRASNIRGRNVQSYGCYRLMLKTLPNSRDKVLEAIRDDRSQCPGFFPYHPGFTASQHVELMLEEQRIERQEQHAESISQLQAKYAKRLNFATWALVIVTAVLVVVTAFPDIPTWATVALVLVPLVLVVVILCDKWPDISAWIASLAS